MSRSYCKAQKYRCNTENWNDKSFRSKNRMCAQKEMNSPDYGDVVFPVCKEYVKKWGYGSKSYIFKNEIRNDYFLEIRNIINGYNARRRGYYRDIIFNDYGDDDSFIELYNRIKGLVPDDGRKYQYEWLNLKIMRKAIKSWNGKPLDVLKHLSDTGLIEKAVIREYKKQTAK